MIHWYTGQPGHGKTLSALAHALEFKQQGRQVYVCNVRGFDYGKSGMLELSPDDFKDWMNTVPDTAVVLVDEAYEHGMLPKRPAGSRVPAHVEQLAKHRHRGLDFIFVCQSPDTQCDNFVRDLIDWHHHVRRKFGTSWQVVLSFDHFESRPLKALPTVKKSRKLPKAAMGLYESTVLDTTEKRIPWYIWATVVGLPLAIGMLVYTFGGLTSRMAGDDPLSTTGAPVAAAHTASAGGAAATGRPVITTTADYVQQFAPRVPSQPWSAPAYDSLSVPSDPPRVFCMSSGTPVDGSCTCLTEQGTRYVMPDSTCRAIARHGQYEPYHREREGVPASGEQLQDKARQDIYQSTVVGYQEGQRGDVFPRSPGYDGNKAGLPTL